VQPKRRRKIELQVKEKVVAELEKNEIRIAFK